MTSFPRTPLPVPTANEWQTAAVVAITEVRSEDKSELAKVVSAVKDGYMANTDNARKQWGGGIMGAKANMRMAKKQKAIDTAIKV